MGANLREAVAATAYASLKWTPEWERAIDRVAASGKVDALGLRLWKAKYMLESQAYLDARVRMQGRYLKRWPKCPPWMKLKIIEQCLAEYIAPQCVACRGAKEMIVGEKRVICEKCEGSGARRYSDGDRARAMRVSHAEAVRHMSIFDCITDEISFMDSEVNKNLVIELEREGVDTAPIIRSIRLQQHKDSRLPVTELPR